MLLSRLTLAALVLAVNVSGALGLAAMIGDTFVKLLPPAGFCELTPRYEFDGRTVALISAYMAGESIKLLAMSADCNQLDEAREGKRQLDDVATYLVENADIKMPTPFSVTSKCSTLRILSKSPIGTDIDARLASTVEKIKVNEAGSIGVIAEDENACYTATLIKNKTETGIAEGAGSLASKYRYQNESDHCSPTSGLSESGYDQGRAAKIQKRRCRLHRGEPLRCS